MNTVDETPLVKDLLENIYGELRRIAAARLAQTPPGATLQPTALVHEAWIRLVGARQTDWQSRAHFLAAAAEAMRHILIDRARRRSATRHGGGQQRVNIEHIEVPIDICDDDRNLIISAAIDKLAAEHPAVAELVKLRFFAGLEVAEAAQVLGLPRSTAFRRWEFARTWLYRELCSESGSRI